MTEITDFQQIVWDYYHDHGRHDLPWRQPEADGAFDLYKIMVSEVMLQQTQVSRVTTKYHEFLTLFPSAESLSRASLGEVIKAWSGLGYNRRAKFLWQAATIIVGDQKHFDRANPDLLNHLVSLPGIGSNTAAAIATYTFNLPVAFIETNIRTVFIYHFFVDEEKVSDHEILTLVSESLDQEHPREWYWALMDYGSFLKQTVGNLNRSSTQYTKQSKFEGSKRQLRGEVLRQLASQAQSKKELGEKISDKRLDSVLSDLLQEQMISEQSGKLTL